MKTIISLMLCGCLVWTACNTHSEKGKEEMKTTTETNPLLAPYDTPFGVPPFEKVKDVDYLPAFKEAIKQHNNEIEAITSCKDAPTFENTIIPFEYSGMLLNRISYLFHNLLSANSTDSLQAAARVISPLLSAHNDDVSLNEKLFSRVKAVYEQKAKFTGEDSMLIVKLFNGFEKEGANLSPTQKVRLREINQRLALLGLEYGDNVRKEVNKFKLWISNEKDLDGLPQSVIDAAAQDAKEDAKPEGKWLFTIQRASMYPFLQYAKNRDLRKKLYLGYINKGDNNDSLDNKKYVVEMVNLRLEKAKMFGYNNYANFRVHDCMAKNDKNIYKLLNQIWTPALNVAKEEAADMQKMIKAEGGTFTLEGWDWRYYSEKIRKARYDLSDEEMRPYFELENVQQGAFNVATKLYGLKFEAIKDIPLMHPDAHAFKVSEEGGKMIGVLYVDYYNRASKEGGAWMTNYRDQYIDRDGKLVLPIISMTCNFSKPTGDAPTLLSFEQASTLFHEFGHSLHGLLSNCKYPTLSGTNVARDFVEFPSQFNEHWAAQPEVMKDYAKNYKTGEPIPDSLIAKIKKSGTYGTGFETVELVAAALLDMDYHTITTIKDFNPDAFEKASLDKIGLIPSITVRYRSTYFNHIFNGDYQAGYYSYLWAEMIDDDAFAAFEEKGIFNKELALSLRNNILSRGCTMDEGLMYRNFRGRDPEIKALLKDRGLVK